MSYLRFVARERRDRGYVSNDPFPLAYRLARDTGQPVYYRRPLRAHLTWFEAYLPVPSRFERRFGRTSTGVGVCWFRASAQEHIARIRAICGILDEIGYPILSRWDSDPGRIVYQDDFQIVAIECARPAHEYSCFNKS